MNQLTQIINLLRKNKSEGFWQRHIVTIILTLLNLGLTSISVYYNYFRVVEVFQARVVPGSFQEDMFNDSLSIKIAIYNPGNRHALLSSMELVVVNIKNGKYSSWQNWPHNRSINQTPIVLRPNEISILQYKIAVENTGWSSVAMNCDSILNPFPINDIKCVDFAIYSVAVNSEGRSFESIARVSTVNISNNRIIGVGTYANDVNLFENNK